MARHCHKKHDLYTYYLKEGKRPSEPWHPKWKKFIDNPQPITMFIDASDESSESSHIDDHEADGVGAASDHENGEDEQSEMAIGNIIEVDDIEDNQNEPPQHQNPEASACVQARQQDHLQAAPKKEKPNLMLLNAEPVRLIDYGQPDPILRAPSAAQSERTKHLRTSLD